MRQRPNFTSTYRGVFNVKVLVGAFNQQKALEGAFSEFVKNDCETDGSFSALVLVLTWKSSLHPPHFSTQVLMNFTHPWDYF